MCVEHRAEGKVAKTGVMMVGWDGLDTRRPSQGQAASQTRCGSSCSPKVVLAKQASSSVELASLMQVPDLVSSLQLSQLAGSCRGWLSACRSPTWDPAVHIAMQHVRGFLGSSRCLSLASTSRSWGCELRAVEAASHVPSQRRGDARAAALEALKAPAFAFESSLSEEDALYAVLADRQWRHELPGMLGARSDICGYAEIYSMIEGLKPHCQVPEEAVSVLFGPRVEREKTQYLHPRPIHYAVARRSPRLVQMLIGAAEKAGNLDQMLQKVQGGGIPQAMSPLFFAVLFGDKEVVNILKRAGSTINEVDISATSKLHRAGLWGPFQERLQALDLHDVAASLDAGLQEAREKAVRSRAAIRAALLG
mmetsp:Transcript_137372/g.356962  ORF Transcript_137372/g.356962 Transcript_137372/m.356962 type:complete len:365 (-) Transcript_137372:180-1274(-)